jgi:hypothetical protein
MRKDVAPKIKPVIPAKPGEVPEGRLGVYKADGVTRVGHVGPSAGQPTVARFLGHPHARLTKIGGRPAWQEIGPTSGRGAVKAAAVANAKLKRSLRTAKGSNP